jgi:hypothetical protein
MSRPIDYLNLIMARELDEKDIELIEKLVPEIADMLDSGIELEYMNILPPVANHHSRDINDFEERLQKLSAEDVKYLADKVIDGSEALSCLYPEYAEVFFTIVERTLSEDVADRLREVYETGGDCGTLIKRSDL